MSLDEMGQACCTSRDFHQTAALFRCLLNSAAGGVRTRWIGLDAGHGWGYLQRLSLSSLRIHPTVFNALDAQHGWLSHREQIRLLRTFPHINEIHCHYSPDIPVEWGAELGALACRTPIGQEEATAASASSVHAAAVISSLPARCFLLLFLLFLGCRRFSFAFTAALSAELGSRG